MKRVFEGYIMSKFPLSDYTVETFCKMVRSIKMSAWTKRVRITVEDLPEQPEKNCGPAEAKAEGWEQRYRDKYCCGFYKADCCYSKCSHIEMMAFIRAEIERVREEEKQAIVAFLRGHWLMTDGIAPMASDIEQNRHREGQK